MRASSFQHGVLLLAALSLVASEEETATTTTEKPFRINFPDCYADLLGADKNGDGIVKKDEYLGFIQTYASKQKCIENQALTLQQRIAFTTIACSCLAVGPEDCCMGTKAQILTAGALNEDRTAAQEAYLTSACRITDETLGPPLCVDPPLVKGVPPVFNIFESPAPEDDPFEWWWILLAAALLLLLCCCGFAIVKRRQKHDEEEPAKTAPRVAPAPPLQSSPRPPADDIEAPVERTPGGLPVVKLRPVKKPEDLSEYDEEGRKRRGGGPTGEDEEEEDGRKRAGASRIPPWDKDNPEFKLRPVPPTEKEEDPDWDHPGRPFDYPKDKDEMSAGEVEHYEPDGGVHIPERPQKKSTPYTPQWERGVPVDPDERDTRKHRIQSGLGQGEVWDKLDASESGRGSVGGTTGGFDWVVQNALGTLGETDEMAHDPDFTESNPPS